MHRRQFLQSTTLAAAAFLPLLQQIQGFGTNETIIGHGDFRYRPNPNWSQAPADRFPVKDCHEMAMDKKGRIFLCTNDTRNNILIYNKDGNVLDAWGREYPGAHGLTLHDENGTEILYIADYERNEVVKTTLEGKVLQVFGCPLDAGKYAQKSDFHPTETAIAPNGDVYIADGYGQDWVVHYGSDGQLKNIFGGKGNQPANLNNAHGIALDQRDPANPVLLVTSRVENAVKRYTLEGKYLETIELPGAYICRPVVHGENVYFAVLVSKMPFDSQSGFVCILDKNNKVVSCPAGSTPRYGAAGNIDPLYQTIKVFKHPHDVLIDGDGNLYVAQWNAGNVYPIQLQRV